MFFVDDIDDLWQGGQILDHGDVARFGSHSLGVRATPGHTNGCSSLVLDNDVAVFTGDAVLIRGCGRTDFQEGDSRMLYKSVHEQIFTLPDSCLIFPAHDYKGRSYSTVGEEKKFNPRLSKSEEEFIGIMSQLNLSYPRMIDIAVRNLMCDYIVTGHFDLFSIAAWTFFGPAIYCINMVCQFTRRLTAWCHLQHVM